MSLEGRWRIVEMDLWDREAMELLGPAFIEFHRDRTGRFRFVAVEGYLDCRDTERDGRPGVEFTLDGDDDGHPASGRGWAVSADDGSLCGRIHLHLGDDSGFRAVPAMEPKPQTKSEGDAGAAMNPEASPHSRSA